ncbi:MAG TPA: VWA domain-containing protein [Pyrinomonadaceae bacterium]|nr:VWA domain-containing protein [Pyrinomonadaceae bacterium]
MSKRFLLALIAVLCAISPSLAQTQSDDVVRITTNLVQIDVVVSKNGKAITDLKAEDFEIFEDGKPQTIISFAYISNLSKNAADAVATPGAPGTSGQDPNTPSDPDSPPPIRPDIPRRRIALVVDDYGLSAQSMAGVRRQLRKFIDKQLNPNDLIAIIRTSRARRELPQFTNDRARINKAWEQLEWNQCSRVNVRTIPRVGDNANVGCATAAFDESISSLRAIVKALGQVPGRKSMIIFSDDMPLREDEKIVRGGSVLQVDDAKGDEAQSYHFRLRRLAELAIRSSVVIYGVDAGGLQLTSMTAADATARPRVSGSEGNGLFVKQLRDRSKLIESRRDGANMIAKETGGFLVHDQNEFQLDKILDEQGGYYLIGYRPSTETFNKRFHKLKARVKKSGLEVRTRSGFFGLTEEEAKKVKETSRP